jgi:hypothetical protein
MTLDSQSTLVMVEQRLRTFLEVAAGRHKWSDEELQLRSKDPSWILDEAEAYALLATSQANHIAQLEELRKSVDQIGELPGFELQRAGLHCVRMLLPVELRALLSEAAIERLSIIVASPCGLPASATERAVLFRRVHSYICLSASLPKALEATTINASHDKTIISPQYIDDFLAQIHDPPKSDDPMRLLLVAADAMLYEMSHIATDRPISIAYDEASTGLNAAMLIRENEKLMATSRDAADVFKLRYLAQASVSDIAKYKSVPEERVTDLWDAASASMEPSLIGDSMHLL